VLACACPLLPCPADLAGCTSGTEVQSTLGRLVAGWGALVESGTFVPIQDSAILQGRSSAMLVALCTMYTTTVGITMYVCYMCLWADVVRWLRLQARSAGEEPGQDVQSEHVIIQGCRLQREQLHSIWTTPAAMLLINSTGLKGQLSRVCIHQSVVNILCVVCLLLSQALAQKVLPRMLSEQALDCCYPLLQGT
jgi:hypothetical protein